MNNLGVVAGFYVDSSGVQHGFVDRDGRFTAINDPNAGTASGQGTNLGYINDFGDVTGSYTDSNGNTVAFAGSLGSLTTVSDPLAPPFRPSPRRSTTLGSSSGNTLTPAKSYTGSLRCAGSSPPLRTRPGPKARI